MSHTPHIVITGGGTGSYVVASGLRKQAINITMLMTMVDDGGSNRIIRDEFGLLPTSGIRQAIVALSENQTMLRKLFTYRYHQGGTGLKGMTFGNLFMAAMSDIMGSQKLAIEETCQLLQVKGQILPISYDDVRLVATYEDGSQVVGEHEIDEPTHTQPLKITNLTTKPTAHLSDSARQALLDADLIILGPGDFYTNTISNLVVDGMTEVLQQTSARVLFIANLMTKQSETPNYSLRTFLEDLHQYVPLTILDHILINNNDNYPQEVLTYYQAEHSHPVRDDLGDSLEEVAQMLDLEAKKLAHIDLIRADLLSRVIPQKSAGDELARSMIRHDPHRLASEIMKLI